MIILIMGMLCTRLNLAIKSLMQGQFAKTELTTVYSPADINPSSSGHGLSILICVCAHTDITPLFCSLQKTISGTNKPISFAVGLVKLRVEPF